MLAGRVRRIPALAAYRSSHGAHASRIVGGDQRGRGGRLSLSLPSTLPFWGGGRLGSLPPPLILDSSEPYVPRCPDAARLGGAEEVREGDVVERDAVALIRLTRQQFFLAG